MYDSFNDIRIVYLRLFRVNRGVHRLWTRAYEDDRARRVVKEWRAMPVVPPRMTRRKLWSFDRKLYARRNEMERLFDKLKWYRRVGTRYDKLELMFAGFIYLALVACLH